MSQSAGLRAFGERVTVHAQSGLASHHAGRTGVIVGHRAVLGVIIYAVRLDPARTGEKPGSPVELFASELRPSADANRAPAPIPTSSATNLAPFFDNAWEGKEFDELAAAPVDALRGVSRGDADLLQESLGIETVHDLATHPYIITAQAITTFADADS